MSRVLTDGRPIPEDGSHLQIKDNGQQREYVRLSDDELAKGFVRPVRESYIHTACGTQTRMHRKLAETYARDPYFYSGTFCSHCQSHFPVGEDGQFVWEDGSKVGT